MRKSSPENIVFSCATLALLCAHIVAHHAHHHFANPRIQYAVAHLSAALFASALFTAAVGLCRAYFSQPNRLQNRSTLFYLGVIVAVFACFWLPVVLAGGFSDDDWLLLAAASIRKIIYLHPQFSWHTLDSVDGNFRPLGTVLYISYLYHFFGLHPLPYLAGNFLVNLLASITAFFIVRELGYSRLAAAAASLLYISRSITYTPNAWIAALGDALVILLCALVVLCVLRANKRVATQAFAYHALAWLFFLIATFAKQSAFTIPLIVALVLFLRPGDAPARPFAQRLRAALLALLVYGSTAAVIFFHAKSLLGSRTPYPISLTLDSITGLFNYVIWYFFTFVLPPHAPLANILPRLAGLATFIVIILLARKFPRALGERPGDMLFLLLAAFASLSIFLLLPTRGAGYYGAMASLWISLALGIALTRFTPATSGERASRIACFLFCALIVTGFLDVRIKQTGLIPSGGYLWGTCGAAIQTTEYRRLTTLLANTPHNTVILVDVPPESAYAAMLLLDPTVTRILAYDSKHNSYQANDLQGYRPEDTYDALNDTSAFHWTQPIVNPDEESSGALDQALWLSLRNGMITPLPPPTVTTYP